MNGLNAVSRTTFYGWKKHVANKKRIIINLYIREISHFLPLF